MLTQKKAKLRIKELNKRTTDKLKEINDYLLRVNMIYNSNKIEDIRNPISEAIRRLKELDLD